MDEGNEVPGQGRLWAQFGKEEGVCPGLVLHRDFGEFQELTPFAFARLLLQRGLFPFRACSEWGLGIRIRRYGVSGTILCLKF
jgi:hypothetical protein